MPKNSRSIEILPTGRSHCKPTSIILSCGVASPARLQCDLFRILFRACTNNVRRTPSTLIDTPMLASASSPVPPIGFCSPSDHCLCGWCAQSATWSLNCGSLCTFPCVTQRQTPQSHPQTRARSHQHQAPRFQARCNNNVKGCSLIVVTKSLLYRRQPSTNFNAPTQQRNYLPPFPTPQRWHFPTPSTTLSHHLRSTPLRATRRALRSIKEPDHPYKAPPSDELQFDAL